MITRRQEITGRILLESFSWEHCAFLTLTYADAPEQGVNKEDLQLFFKRLRWKLDSKVRYYACGEYGYLNKRAHYHAIVFGLDVGEVSPDVIAGIWKHGFITMSEFHPNRAAYTANYVTKKMSSESHPVGQNPEFALMSRMPGLGREYIDKICDRLAKKVTLKEAGGVVDIENLHFFRFDGKLYPFDRYAITKIREALGHESGAMKAHMKAVKKRWDPERDLDREINEKKEAQLRAEKRLQRTRRTQKRSGL